MIHMTINSKLIRSAVLCVMVVGISGCNMDIDGYQRRISDEFKASDGREVNVFLKEVEYFPAELLDWAKENNLQSGDTVFARADTSEGCYILGPSASLRARAGAHFHGVVASDLVYEWPVEVFSANPTCLPVSGQILSSPVEVIISRPRDITRSQRSVN